jgi:hypothetical protein
MPADAHGAIAIQLARQARARLSADEIHWRMVEPIHQAGMLVDVPNKDLFLRSAGARPLSGAAPARPGNPGRAIAHAQN